MQTDRLPTCIPYVPLPDLPRRIKQFIIPVNVGDPDARNNVGCGRRARLGLTRCDGQRLWLPQTAADERRKNSSVGRVIGRIRLRCAESRQRNLTGDPAAGGATQAAFPASIRRQKAGSQSSDVRVRPRRSRCGNSLPPPVYRFEDDGHALRNDGTVWSFGGSQPVQVSGLSDVAAIHQCCGGVTALKRDGTVWVWWSGILDPVEVATGAVAVAESAVGPTAPTPSANQGPTLEFRRLRLRL